MDVELEQYYKSNSALDLMISELRLKLDCALRESNSQQLEVSFAHSFLARVRQDLRGCGALAEDAKKLKKGVRHLFAKYCQEEAGFTGDSVDLDPQEEFNREREHLERNLDSLRQRISKDIEVLNGDHSRLTREGINLTEEMNLLRREAKLLRRQHKSMDAETEAIMSPPFGSTSTELDRDHTVSDLNRELEIQEGQVQWSHLNYSLSSSATHDFFCC